MSNNNNDEEPRGVVATSENVSPNANVNSQLSNNRVERIRRNQDRGGFQSPLHRYRYIRSTGFPSVHDERWTGSNTNNRTNNNDINLDSNLNVYHDSTVLNYDEIANDSRFSHGRPFRFIESYMRNRSLRNPFLSSTRTTRNPIDQSISNITTNTRNLASFISTSQENIDPNDILNNLDDDTDSLNNSRFLNPDANNISNISNAVDLNVYRDPVYTLNLSEETSEESDEASSSSYILNNASSVEITNSQNNLQLLRRRRASLREFWQRRLNENEISHNVNPIRIVNQDIDYNHQSIIDRRNKKDFYIHTKVFLIN